MNESKVSETCMSLHLTSSKKVTNMIYSCGREKIGNRKKVLEEGRGRKKERDRERERKIRRKSLEKNHVVR